MWRIKQLFEKYLPYLIAGAIAFGGYNLYKSSHRRYPTPVARMIYNIPLVGSHIRHLTRGSRGITYRRGKHRHHRRHGHHSRRYRRRHR